MKIILKNGTVIDPSQKLKEQKDILIEDGTIAKIEKNLSGDEYTKVIDVAGNYVVPGLIDMHCHIYPRFPVEPDGLPTIHPEAHMFQSGVTTAVDAGTCGVRDFIRFKEEIIDQSRLRILAFINIASGGMVNLESEQDIRQFTPQTAAAMAREFDSVVVGIKTAHYWVGKPFDDKHPAWESVDQTLEAGVRCNKMAMFDFQPNLPERTYEELIGGKMRPGDIHTHVYAQQFPILNDRGKVNRFMFEARERGIIFDLGHGAGSFWFRNAVPAYEQGFYPDTISTDLYLDNVAGPVINLLHIMSKYLCIGMPLEEIIYRVTKRPAELLRHEELGTLSIGSPADVTVLRMEHGNYGYADSGKARLKGDKRLECLMTIRAGEIVYDPMALSMPQWEEAPEIYGTSPGVIQL
ncbi:amidohydrolase family protein [Novisyntrophococcus fermenticellae]|uniref:amidohydrolase family protein n=1 Tax=Novisyntrophococcus fermenticellae TaxID=2068655 RepID=UPI001E314DCA|nr:amidohydrolase/deacetylase family metallohydrolase [Novisyntrophococcus fermenticellae]